MQPNPSRPDIDIEEEIGQLIRSYAPLKSSRGYFHYQCLDGHVRLTGNVRSPQARRVLVDNVPRLRGVVSVDSSQLYDDEMIRFAVGQLIPPRVFASVQYGAVSLTGRPPEGASPDAITEAVGKVPGVRRVGAEFGVVADQPPRPETIS